VSAPDDCRVCAACCFSHAPEHARVLGSDWDRLDEAAQRLTTWRGNRCFMRIEDGRCAALAVDARAGSFACSIYPMRPDVCRALERGSPACLGELEAKRARPAELLVQLRASPATSDPSPDGF
jgi:hypothetical protein